MGAPPRRDRVKRAWKLAHSPVAARRRSHSSTRHCKELPFGSATYALGVGSEADGGPNSGPVFGTTPRGSYVSAQGNALTWSFRERHPCRGVT